MNTSSLNNLFNTADWETIFIFGFLGIYLLVMLFSIIMTIIDYSLQSFAIFRMARLAGYDKPWLGFIPFARQYIVINLPYKQFNCCGIRTYNKAEVFKWYVILKVAPFVVSFGLSAIGVVFALIPVIGSLIGGLFSLVTNVLVMAVNVATILCTWSIRSDLFDVYQMKKPARITLLILTSTGIYIPLLYSITLLVLSGREPRFGYGKYYDPNHFIFDEDYEEEDAAEDENWVQIVD